MHVAFEAELPQQGHGVGDTRGRDGAAVGGERLVVQALDADLHLGAAQRAQSAAGLGGDEVGARFHHQPDDALRCRFVGAMQGEKIVPGTALRHLFLAVGLPPRLVVGELSGVDALLKRGCRGGQGIAVAGEAASLVPCPALSRLADALLVGKVQGAEKLACEPALVAFGVVAPGAAQHDKLHFVGDVPHGRERAQTGGHLQEGVEPAALGPLAGRLVGKIALRHTDVVRAEHAGARARPGLREHGDGGHARGGAPGLGLQKAHEGRVGRLAHLPRRPPLGVLSLHVQVEGEESPLGHLARAVVGGTVVPPHQLVEPRGVGAAVGPFAANDAAAHGFDYFQECFFHKNAKDTRFAQGSQRGSDRCLQFA